MSRQLLRQGFGLLLLASSGAQAATVWDEQVNGDLANDGLAPTVLAVATGNNLVNGSVGDAGLGVDRDYFSFTVAAGRVLTGIHLLDAAVSGGASFFAIQAGAQVTTSPSGAGIENLLGYGHYDNSFIGGNLLSLVPGFSGALPAGSYAVWVQDTGGPAFYKLDLQISAVPEPGTAALGLAGLLGLLRVARQARMAAMRAQDQ